MADQKKDRTFLIVATVIDLVIIYDMSSGNPIVQNWYKQNLHFLFDERKTPTPLGSEM